jgi:hypothetical protein
MRSVLLVVAWVGLSACGRSHVLNDVTYDFTMTKLLRDDCSFGQPGALVGTGTLSTTGDLVTMKLSLPPGRLAGNYLSGEEQMELDGTFLNQQVAVGGQACIVDTESVHLTTVTVDATHFTGTMSVNLDAKVNPQACTCRFWFEFSAAKAP